MIKIYINKRKKVSEFAFNEIAKFEIPIKIFFLLGSLSESGNSELMHCGILSIINPVLWEIASWHWWIYLSWTNTVSTGMFQAALAWWYVCISCFSIMLVWCSSSVLILLSTICLLVPESSPGAKFTPIFCRNCWWVMCPFLSSSYLPKPIFLYNQRLIRRELIVSTTNSISFAVWAPDKLLLCLVVHSMCNIRVTLTYIFLSRHFTHHQNISVNRALITFIIRTFLTRT